jgi:broad specificity phosphatase PhoE
MGGRFIGSSDVPVAPEGLTQIPALAQRIMAQPPARVIASPMLRVRQTWDALLQAEPGLSSCPVQEDPALREVDFGDWEGLDFEQVNQGHPRLVAAWTQAPMTFAFPRGEALADFYARVNEAGQRIAAMDNEAILVLAHGGVIRALICLFLRLDMRISMLIAVQPARLCSVDLHDAGGVLTGLNR